LIKCKKLRAYPFIGESIFIAVNAYRIHRITKHLQLSKIIATMQYPIIAAGYEETKKNAG
jgi:hypothetical protein